MDSLQSQINQIEARIKQFENSDLHTAEQKAKLIEKEKIQLEKLYLQKANQIEVNNPEILSNHSNMNSLGWQPDKNSFCFNDKTITEAGNQIEVNKP